MTSPLLDWQRLAPPRKQLSERHFDLKLLVFAKNSQFLLLLLTPFCVVATFGSRAKK